MVSTKILGGWEGKPWELELKGDKKTRVAQTHCVRRINGAISLPIISKNEGLGKEKKRGGKEMATYREPKRHEKIAQMSSEVSLSCLTVALHLKGREKTEGGGG